MEESVGYRNTAFLLVCYNTNILDFGYIIYIFVFCIKYKVKYILSIKTVPGFFSAIMFRRCITM